MNPKLTIIESPFSGETNRNIMYARLCMKDSLDRGEFPFASHLLYSQPYILQDERWEERNLGINAGLAWGRHADLIAVYKDFGISNGMDKSITYYKELGIPIEYRNLEGWNENEF